MAWGRGCYILFLGLKLWGIMGYRASISLRGLTWPQPQGQPSYLFPLRTISRRRGGKLRYQTVFIYLFIYVHLHQKRTVQGTGSEQTSGVSLCLLHRIFCYISVEHHLQKYSQSFFFLLTYIHDCRYGFLFEASAQSFFSKYIYLG